MIFSDRKKTDARKKRQKFLYVPRKTAGIPSDVNGSYIGMTEDGSRPVQDADDL